MAYGVADSLRSGRDDPALETSELAIASVFLGIVWLFGLGSLAAIWLGRRSLREIAHSGGRVGGRTLALAGIAIGVAGLLSLGLLVAFVMDSAG